MSVYFIETFFSFVNFVFVKCCICMYEHVQQLIGINKNKSLKTI